MPTRKILITALTALVCTAAAPSALAEMCEDCEPGGGTGGGSGTTYATPDTTIESAPQAPVQSRRPSISYKSSLASVRYQCRLAGAAADGWANVGVSGCGTTAAAGTTTAWSSATDLADGTHHFQVRACKDHTATVTKCDDTPAKASFTIDTVAPTATFTGLDPDEHINTPTTVFLWDAENPFSPTVRCAIDPTGADIEAQLAPCNKETTVGGDGFAQGEHRIYLKVRDSAGNWSSTASLRFVWDTVGPVVGNISSVANTKRPTVRYSVADARGTVESTTCTLKGQGIDRAEPCSSTAWTSGADLADGLYSLTVTAEDELGNGGNSITEHFVVDTVAPALGAIAWDATARTLAWTAGEDAEGTTCAIDSGVAAACTSPFDASGLAARDHVLRVTVRDHAGNETTATKAFTIPAPAKPPVSGADTKSGATVSATSGAAAAQPNGSATASTPTAASGPRTAAAPKKAAAKKKICFKTKKVRGKKKRVKVPCAKRTAKKRTAKKRG